MKSDPDPETERWQSLWDWMSLLEKQWTEESFAEEDLILTKKLAELV